MTGRAVFLIDTIALTGTHGEHMCRHLAKATAIGSLPMPVAAIVSPHPVNSCFPDPESSNFNTLRLISFRLARTRAYARPRGLARRQRLSRRLAT